MICSSSYQHFLFLFRSHRTVLCYHCRLYFDRHGNFLSQSRQLLQFLLLAVFCRPLAVYLVTDFRAGQEVWIVFMTTDSQQTALEIRQQK